MRLSLTGIFLGICGEFSQMELMSREQCDHGGNLKNTLTISKVVRMKCPNILDFILIRLRVGHRYQMLFSINK